MSLVDQSPERREVGRSSHNHKVEQTYRNASPETSESVLTHHETYDDAIFDDFLDMDQDALTQNPKQVQPVPEVPALPEKSALRASRLLDNLVGLKFGGSIETTSLTQTTPHDAYLSSEEDASSSADDFSDFDYDSSSEDCRSPVSSRRSHEDTARVVSVVFSGKPSIIDLSTIRRSTSPNSIEARRQSIIGTSQSAPTMIRRTSTSSTFTDSPTKQQTTRTSSMLSSFITKQKPLFLQIDPYANGSTYSLDVHKEEQEEHDRPKTPKTPTAMFKSMQRTFTLAKKRSRPMLNNSFHATASKDDMATPISPSKLDLAEPTQEAELEETEKRASIQIPQPPVTYNDIMRAAKKNAHAAPQTPTTQPQSPESPASIKRGILNGFTARRKSIKLNSKLL